MEWVVIYWEPKWCQGRSRVDFCVGCKDGNGLEDHVIFAHNEMDKRGLENSRATIS